MSRVMFTVSYVIPDGKRTEYLGLSTKLKSFFHAAGVEYSVFEDQTAHNHFREVFVYPSQEAFDASDDPETTKPVADVIDAIYAMAKDVTYDVASEVA